MGSKKDKQAYKTSLIVGDTVMVLAGCNSLKAKELKGKTGKILKFLPKTQRVVVEGLNIIKRRKKALTSGESSRIIEKEGSIHISNVMYYNSELGRPVRICMKVREDGVKVRGFVNSKTKSFEQIGA